ncbi:MAG: hypothetical protein K2G09_07180 [Paramuribaculum sp.]|nr:hypothetical protein [Paramuribaculum sp.]
MKQNLSLISFGVIALFSATTISSCSDSSGDNPLQPIELSRAEEQVCADLNDFSVNLLKAAVDGSNGENVAVSPLGAAMVAGMFGNAITAQDRTELATALGIDANDFSALNSYNAKMLATLPRLDKSAKVALANGSWFDQFRVSLSDQYKSILENDYSSEINMVDFKNPSTLTNINNWVAKRTDNEITRILEGLNPDDVAVWINALYFKGYWKYKFDKSKTQKEDFVLANGLKTKVDMMAADENVSGILIYKRIGGYMGNPLDPDADFDSIYVTTVCSIDYGNSGFSFNAVMPDERITIKDYLSENSDILFKWPSNTRLLGEERSGASLYFPKLNLSTDTDLIPIMQSLGVNKIFGVNSGVRMPGVGLETGFVGVFKQSIKLDVDEDGATVKVVTAGKGGDLLAYAPPTTAKFNHPFIYFIREESTGTILLAGTVMNPNE